MHSTRGAVGTACRSRCNLPIEAVYRGRDLAHQNSRSGRAVGDPRVQAADVVGQLHPEDRHRRLPLHKAYHFVWGIQLENDRTLRTSVRSLLQRWRQYAKAHASGHSLR